MEYTINYKIIGDQLFIDEPTNYCIYIFIYFNFK